MSGFAVTDYNPPAVGILSARLGSLQSTDIAVNKDITLGVNSDRYQTFLTPSQNVDQFALNDLDTINSKKLEIVGLGDDDTFYGAQSLFGNSTDATNAVNNIYGADIITSVGVASAITFGVNAIFVAGRFLTQANGAAAKIIATQSATTVALVSSTGIGTTAFNTTDQCRVGTSTVNSDNSTIVGVPASISLAGFGNINQDRITISTYPNLEPININVDNPYSGQTVNTLGAGNTGLGFGNTFLPNTGSFIGTVFAFDTTADVGAATSITNISNEITNTLRIGVTTFTNTVNIIKPYKVSFAINVWSLDRSKLENNLAMDGLSTAIGILNDPQFGGPY